MINNLKQGNSFKASLGGFADDRIEGLGRISADDPIWDQQNLLLNFLRQVLSEGDYKKMFSYFIDLESAYGHHAAELARQSYFLGVRDGLNLTELFAQADK